MRQLDRKVTAGNITPTANKMSIQQDFGIIAFALVGDEQHAALKRIAAEIARLRAALNEALGSLALSGGDGEIWGENRANEIRDEYGLNEQPTPTREK